MKLLFGIILAALLCGCSGDDSDKKPAGEQGQQGGEQGQQGGEQGQQGGEQGQQGGEQGQQGGEQGQQGGEQGQQGGEQGQQGGEQGQQGGEQGQQGGEQGQQGGEQGQQGGEQGQQGGEQGQQGGEQGQQGGEQGQQGGEQGQQGGDDGKHKCGSTQCSREELCQKGKCVARNNTKDKATQKCNPETFVESCDQNSLVHCLCGEDGCKVEVTECGDLTCALKVEENFGMCAIPDDKCTSKGDFELCVEGEYEHYIEIFDCAMATDGKFYPFRTFKTADCIGVCLDKYSCNRNNEDCGADFKEHCDGNLATYCTEGKIYRMNCADYNVGCIMNGDEPACDF